MNKIKIEKVVDIFCDNLNIGNIRYRNILKELMVNIIQKYETCGIKEIEDDQQYLIKSNNGKYSVEDFFLNIKNFCFILTICQPAAEAMCS